MSSWLKESSTKKKAANIPNEVNAVVGDWVEGMDPLDVADHFLSVISEVEAKHFIESILEHIVTDPNPPQPITPEYKKAWEWAKS